MKITMNLPDELNERIQYECGLMHMNRTQYMIRAVQQMLEADALLRAQPDIKAKMVELESMLSKIRVSDN